MSYSSPKQDSIRRAVLYSSMPVSSRAERVERDRLVLGAFEEYQRFTDAERPVNNDGWLGEYEQEDEFALLQARLDATDAADQEEAQATFQALQEDENFRPSDWQEPTTPDFTQIMRGSSFAPKTERTN